MSDLLSNNKSGWLGASDEDRGAIYDFSRAYMDFITSSKTERLIVEHAEQIAREHGFRHIDEYGELHAGDKVLFNNRGKNLYLAVIGSRNIEEGLNIIGAHADSPRLDLKPQPLYQDGDFAFFNTHYYGGIKKYQWTTIPLAIHGVIVRADGETIQVHIGDDDNDPVFVISDLLPHLGKKQAQEKISDAIKGEKLDVMVGNIPADDSDKQAIKENVMRILNNRYGITEDDFTSAELELVPAFKARSAGFDESLVAAYGQDDKVCVYASLRAMLEIENPERTAVCLFSDKEEIGSMGNTGMESHVFDTFISDLLNKLNVNRPNLLDKVFCNSRMLSADVDAGVDPLYAEVNDMTNSGLVGHGISLNKYTGSGGKYNASDANAEYVGFIKRLFRDNGVKYQFSELGKVDEGGGGTIAYILANKGVDVIDCGVPVISMHSPYEITSKFDIYEAYKGYRAFFRS